MTDKQWEKTTTGILTKCRFCGRMFNGGGGELRNDGVLVGECEHCSNTLSQEVKKERERTIEECRKWLPKRQEPSDSDCTEVRWQKIGSNLAIAEMEDQLKEIRKDFPKE